MCCNEPNLRTFTFGRKQLKIRTVDHAGKFPNASNWLLVLHETVAFSFAVECLCNALFYGGDGAPYGADSGRFSAIACGARRFPWCSTVDRAIAHCSQSQ
jgi:hypothetical protein